MAIGLSTRLKALGSAAERIVKSLLPPETHMEDLASLAGYVEYQGAPANVVPDYIGQRLLDVTSGTFYVAHDLTINGWRSIIGTQAPAAFTSRALVGADNGATLICASAQTATVNTGLPAGFGCAFKGTIAFNGTATVTDVRTTGATNPWCSLVNTGTDAYDVVGSKV